MLIGLSTLFRSGQKRVICWLTASVLLFSFYASAQVITVPAGNPNDSSSRKPFGCYYGYERVAMLFTSPEIGQGGSVTKVGFYVNEVNNPAASTPVVIKMKVFTGTSLTPTTYSSLSSGSTIVYSGNITSGMLNANNWVTVNLNSAFSYGSNNLLILVESNYGSFGGENFDAKEFRHSTTTSNRCQFWEDDLTPPADNGILTKKRPTIQLTFEPNCTGTPTPGNTLSTATTVCLNESFTLSLQSTPTTPGLTYVWQTSSTGEDPWTTVAGATGSTYTTTQTVPTYYRCIVTCDNGGASGTSVKVLVSESPVYDCYCDSYASDISDSKINSFKMADISTSTSPTLCESYTDYTAVPGNIAGGQLVTIEIENGSCSGFFYDSYIGVYIDYNLSGTYEKATELVYGYGPITNFNSIPSFSFNVPTAAPAGITGMRVILQEGDSVPNPCGEYTYGETEDYLLNITAAVPCSGPPSPGATLSTESTVCPNEQFTLTISNYQSNSGISYQWQTSPDNSPGSYTNINGATSASRLQSQTSAKWYRCKVTCDNTGAVTESGPIFIDMKPFYACYCASYAINPEDTKIDTVKIGNMIAGSSPTNCETYTDNTALNLDVDKTFPVSIKIDNGACGGQFYEAYVAVFIDYDKNNVYAANEMVYSFGPTTDLHSIPDGLFTIPAGTQLGKTGMRIVIAEGESVPTACGTYDWGETEDYVINIVDVPPCLVPPIAGVATASSTSLCQPQIPAEITLTLTGFSAGFGQTYQWQSSSNGSEYDDIAGQVSTTANVTVSATTYYRCIVTCSGNSANSEVAMVEVKSVPTGNTESDPIIIPNLPYTDIRDNLSENCWTSDYTNTLPQLSPDVFYELSLNDTSGWLEISTCETNTGFNTYLHLIDAFGNHLTSNNNAGPLCTGNQASIEYYAGTVPAVLYIIVEGLNEDEGAYQLDVNFIPDSATSAQALNITTGNSLLLFPNPSDGNTTLQVNLQSSLNEQADLRLFNALGQLVQLQKIEMVKGKYNGNINLDTSLPDGWYQVQVQSGATVISRPLLIQR